MNAFLRPGRPSSAAANSHPGMAPASSTGLTLPSNRSLHLALDSASTLPEPRSSLGSRCRTGTSTAASAVLGGLPPGQSSECQIQDIRLSPHAESIEVAKVARLNTCVFRLERNGWASTRVPDQRSTPNTEPFTANRKKWGK